MNFKMLVCFKDSSFNLNRTKVSTASRIDLKYALQGQIWEFLIEGVQILFRETLLKLFMTNYLSHLVIGISVDSSILLSNE